MGAKVSAEMLKARELIAAGASVIEAAKAASISTQAVYMSNWYKEWKRVQQTRNCRPKR